MAIPGLYEPENMRRMKIAQMAVVVIAIGLSAYMAATSVLSMREVWSAHGSLREAKTEVAELSRQATNQRRNELKYARPEPGGVDSFAVRLSQWARPRNVHIESFAPEGPPMPGEINSDGVKLGAWNTNKVRVKGRGDYRQLMSLLREFEQTTAPVRLESFVLQPVNEAGKLRITFDLLLTVFEQAGEENKGSAAG